MTEPASGARQPRPARPHFTGRAAILAVVFCAIALSLAYPVREYIAERRQIDQLEAQRQQIGLQVKQLQSEQQQLTSPTYIEQQARDRLHMCLPPQKCYEIIPAKTSVAATVAARRAGMPWYARLWSSVQQADKQQPGKQRRGRQRPGQSRQGKSRPGQASRR